MQRTNLSGKAVRFFGMESHFLRVLTGIWEAVRNRQKI